MSSRLTFHEKIIEDDGCIIEMKIWEVPISEKMPEGVKYSLYCVKAGKILVGYDNHHPKGHHRHYGTQQQEYEFNGVEKLIADFLEDQRRVRDES